MITVGEVRLIRKDDKSIICANVCGQSLEATLWFAVDSEHEMLLNRQSGECFVMGLLPLAMQNGLDIVYSGQLSERFVHGLNEYLIPSMAVARKQYRSMRVSAASLTSSKRNVVPGVGVRAVDGRDFWQILRVHGKDSLYPVTHLLVCDNGQKDALENIEFIEQAACKYNLEPLKLEHNLCEIYHNCDRETGSFLELAGALALSGGLGMYLFNSESALCHKGDKQGVRENLDIVISSFASTERMRIYIFDYEKEGEARQC